MTREFTATIVNEERAEEWARVLGTKTVFIKSPIPNMANLPGHPNAFIYELDLDELTDGQRSQLIAHLADKFGLPAEQVESDLEAHGVPILADDCIIGFINPQKWF